VVEAITHGSKSFQLHDWFLVQTLAPGFTNLGASDTETQESPKTITPLMRINSAHS
jgi:hypothetical protein